MSENDATSIHTMYKPLIPNRPRLRFIEGAADGAADEVKDPAVEPAPEKVAEPDEGSLGDAGKKALDAMKAERATAKAEATAAKQELAELKAQLALKDKPAEEQAIEAAKAEARAEATKAANARILKSELKALATGKLADPADAALYINLADFTVSDDGEVDSDALGAAVTALITLKPHLAAPAQQRFQGAGDGGAAAPAKPTETLADRIAAAHAAGDWRLEMSLQNTKLPDPK